LVLTDEERKARKKKYEKEYNLRPEVIASKKVKQKEYRERNKDKIDKYRREVVIPKNKKIAIEVFSVYSKRHSNSDIPCCRCCGINEHMEFLTIDHIDGRAHLSEKEKELHSKSLNSWLKKNNYPDGFQILCFNCNMAKSDKGHCPHMDMMK
jgi:hypothetical protein